MIKIILFTLFITTDAFASSIVAKVNDVPISKYDLSNYTKMTVTTGQINPTKADMDKLAPQILEQLIEQRIRLNAIEQAEIIIPQAQIDEAITNIETQSGQKKGSLLALFKAQNIPASALYEKIKTDIGWFQLLNYKFGRTITVTDEEIQTEIENIKNKYNKPHINLYEIFIPVQSVLQDNEIYYQALDMIKAIKDDGNFEGFAKQFSRSPSATNGGALGWVAIDNLPEEFREKLASVNAGEVSDPIRTVDGYYILMVKEKKTQLDDKQLANINEAVIEANIKGKKMDQFAKKYIRDLIHQSVIEKTGK